jgi:hypothetical protein
LARYEQITDISLGRYEGTERDDNGSARWRDNGAKLGYYEYARVAGSGGKTDFNPVYELQATMGTLCNDLNNRAQIVTLAVANGISAKLHPGEIPPNIYNSDDAEWKSYATPTRASGLVYRLSPRAGTYDRALAQSRPTHRL